MRNCVRKLGLLACAWLIPALVWGDSRAGAEPPVRQETGFHHTGWDNLGAVFDLKQSPEGYLWLTTSKGVLRFDGLRFQSVEEVTRGAVHDDEIDSVFLSFSGGLDLGQVAPSEFAEGARLQVASLIDLAGTKHIVLVPLRRLLEIGGGQTFVLEKSAGNRCDKRAVKNGVAVNHDTQVRFRHLRILPVSGVLF